MKILVTGAAGFIGATLTAKLLQRGDEVVGVDNLNDYYDVSLKTARLAQFDKHPLFSFKKMDIADRLGMEELFKTFEFDAVVNLAAQAGVRYSIENPYAYIESNLLGFCNILEGCRHTNIKNLVFASSSSVYGANTVQPFSEHHNVDHPVALYAATKKSNELMAHSYASLYQLPCTGLRFFTVYGPFGRPDMALFKFTKAMLEDKPIDVYNHGKMIRDFTYVDDIIQGIICVIDKPASSNPSWSGDKPDPATSYAPYRIYNIGNHTPVLLEEFITAIEQALGKTAIKNYLPMQQGDVPSTYADISSFMDDFNFKPMTGIQDGINSFIKWYREYYKV